MWWRRAAAGPQLEGLPRARPGGAAWPPLVIKGRRAQAPGGVLVGMGRGDGKPLSAGLFGSSQPPYTLPSRARSAQAGRAREAEVAGPGRLAGWDRSWHRAPTFPSAGAGAALQVSGLLWGAHKSSARVRGARSLGRGLRAPGPPSVALPAPQLPGCREAADGPLVPNPGLESAGGGPGQEKEGAGRGLRTEKTVCRTMVGKWLPRKRRGPLRGAAWTSLAA